MIRIAISAAVLACLGGGLLAPIAARGASPPARSAGSLSGRVFTVAGSGEPQEEAFAGEGVAATSALLNFPVGVTATPAGRMLIADTFNDCVRAVSPRGVITAYAGQCEPTRENQTGPPSGDGGSARSARLGGPSGLSASPAGTLIAHANRISEVFPDGHIDTVVGSEDTDFRGDGGPASDATLYVPSDVAWLPDGGYLIVDSGHQRIRRVTPDGIISTVAGDGERGFSGDGGPATDAALSAPSSVEPLPDGGFLIADSGNARIREVSPTGLISTIAGDGRPSRAGSSGDGGPAVQAAITVSDIARTANGGILFVDRGAGRIRYVDPGGTVHAIAGQWGAGFAGDGGPASRALFESPSSVALCPGGFLVADSGNNRIRFIEAPQLVPRGNLPTRLAVALLPSKVGRRVRRAFTIAFAATRTTQAHVVLTGPSGSRVTATAVKVSANGGRFVIRVGRPGKYHVRASFKAGSQVATAQAAIRVRR